ncbi:hypothetical protein CW712_05750 [Candidatus Bathyarchaeota archaeon]|nr:MAG: hypothetical protein CW712_05750 [Candidatus Bathyarchaeota archaeon]
MNREPPWKLEDVPTPKVGANDVLVKIKASGIYGTDLHNKHGRAQPGKVPIILGHEIAGVVEKCEANVRNVNVGDRVCVHYIISCGDRSLQQRKRQPLPKPQIHWASRGRRLRGVHSNPGEKRIQASNGDPVRSRSHNRMRSCNTVSRA